MKRELHFAGRAVCLQVSGPAALELIDFMFSRLPAAGQIQPHITFNLEDSPDQAGLIFSAPCQPGAEPLAGHPYWGRMQAPASRVISRLLFEVDYHLADLASTGLYLHAASLAKAGQGLLLPAASGSGKSTLTYWLTRQGFDYLSDESSFVASGSLECSGFGRPMCLKKGSLDLFPELQTSPGREVRLENDSPWGWLVDTRSLQPAANLQNPPMKAIVLPQYRAGSDLIIERLSNGRSAFELAGCLTNARNLPEYGFPEIARLAKAIPAWRLTYGDLEQTRPFFEHELGF